MHIVCTTLQHQWLLLGFRKSDGPPPEHETMGQTHESHEEIGDKECLKACTRLKICESLYTCPRAPFTRDEVTFTFRDYPRI
jgi:hypothetical protein